jgi:hypothetical protein
MRPTMTMWWTELAFVRTLLFMATDSSSVTTASPSIEVKGLEFTESLFDEGGGVQLGEDLGIAETVGCLVITLIGLKQLLF